MRIRAQDSFRTMDRHRRFGLGSINDSTGKRGASRALHGCDQKVCASREVQEGAG